MTRLTHPVGWNVDVAEYIPTVRMAVYQNPRLATGSTKPLPESSKRAKKERERRNDERAQLKELSRYYQLEGDSGNEVWETPPLLREGKHTPNDII